MTSIVEQLNNDGNDNRVIPTIEPAATPEANIGAASITPADNEETAISMGAMGGKGRQARNLQFQTAGDYGGKPGKGIVRSQSREPLDLSQFPKKMDPDVKNSIQSEIFKPGGDFDQMLERRRQEMEADLSREEFADDLAKASQKISGAGRALPAGTIEALAEAGVTGDDLDFGDEEFGVGEDEFSDEAEEEEGGEDEQEQYDEKDVTIVDTSGSEFEDEFIDNEDINEMEEEQEEDTTPVEQQTPTQTSSSKLTTERKKPYNIHTIKESHKESGTGQEEKPKEEVISVEGYEDDFGSAGYVNEEISLEEVDPVADTEEDRELRTKYLKEAITEKLNPVSEKLNISGFPIAKRGTKTKKSLNRPAGLSKWPLINTGIVITTKAISGSMMELVRSHVSNGDIKEALMIMYDHVVSAKPMNFIAWAKGIDAEDFDHLFFAFYISAFKGVNYIPIDCHNPECKRKVFITEDIPFIKMVDFHEKKNKNLFDKIYKEEPQAMESDDVVAYRVPISADIAVDFRRSSLYSEYIELSYLNDAFIKKHADIINYIRNIEEIYIIEEGQLVPLDYKIDPNSEGRTVVNKVKAYAKALRSLSSDEIAIIDAYIAKMNEDTIKITYKRPAAKCNICGTDAKEEPMSAAALVFIRNQLGLMRII